MKILIAVHHFPPTFSGGAEWRTERTARKLKQLGHQVEVVCVDSITFGDGQKLNCVERNFNGVKVHGLYFNLSNTPNPFVYRYRNPIIGQYLCDIFQEFKPDVLHLISGYLMSGSTIEAAQKARIPILLTLTDFWFLCPRINLINSDESLCTSPSDPLACALCLHKEQRRYRIPDLLTFGWLGKLLSILWQKKKSKYVKKFEDRRTYLLQLLNTVSTIIAPSLFMKNLYKSNGVDTSRIVYMRQGLDTKNWVDAKVSDKNSYFRIGYIGQIAKHKGVDVLIEAFKRLRAGDKPMRLILYGDTQQFPTFTNDLRKQVKKKKNIIFAGKFENANIRQIHSEIDVLVVPSIWYENSPNVILEAFANSTPVVVSKLGGMAELVENGVNGFQFESGNAKNLAQVLQRFVDHPESVVKLSRRMPIVKTIEQETKELIEIYTSVNEK